MPKAGPRKRSLCTMPSAWRKAEHSGHSSCRRFLVVDFRRFSIERSQMQISDVQFEGISILAARSRQGS
eukprot:1572300-Heterocapsa_arctica.AAC.1